MPRTLAISEDRFPIRGAFTISRGSKTEAHVLTCTIAEGGAIGRGECVPYARYGETIAGVSAAIESVRAAIERGIDRESLLGLMPPGAARNAVDCALFDLEAKSSGRPAHELAGLDSPRPLVTAVTISLGSADEMAAAARALADRPLLKVKVGTADDRSRIRAVVEAAPLSRIILDANEGWTPENLRMHLLTAARHGIAVIEQPLPAGKDEALRGVPHPVPVCADESVHSDGDLERLVGLYDCVNIKLDKTGGLTAALALHRQARAFGFGIMVGCMVGSSLAMAPALLLAQDADFVDLDGPLLLARDREHALGYEGSVVSPSLPALWG